MQTVYGTQREKQNDVDKLECVQKRYKKLIPELSNKP